MDLDRRWRDWPDKVIVLLGTMYEQIVVPDRRVMRNPACTCILYRPSVAFRFTWQLPMAPPGRKFVHNICTKRFGARSQDTKGPALVVGIRGG